MYVSYIISGLLHIKATVQCSVMHVSPTNSNSPEQSRWLSVSSGGLEDATRC